MAVQEQVFGFYIPTVTLMGVGSHKEIGNQIKVLGGTSHLFAPTRASWTPASPIKSPISSGPSAM
jgi:hypothetical protein